MERNHLRNHLQPRLWYSSGIAERRQYLSLTGLTFAFCEAKGMCGIISVLNGLYYATQKVYSVEAMEAMLYRSLNSWAAHVTGDLQMTWTEFKRISELNPEHQLSQEESSRVLLLDGVGSEGLPSTYGELVQAASKRFVHDAFFFLLNI